MAFLSLAVWSTALRRALKWDVGFSGKMLPFPGKGWEWEGGLSEDLG